VRWQQHFVDGFYNPNPNYLETILTERDFLARKKPPSNGNGFFLWVLVQNMTLFWEFLCSPELGMPNVALKWEGNSKMTLKWEFPF